MGRGIGAGLITVAVALSTGCIPSLSMLQRAETEAPGRAELDGSAGGYVGQAGSSGSAGFFPNFEIAGRYGLFSRVDLGLKLWTAGSGTALDVKVEVVKSSRFVLSLDPGLGVTWLRNGAGSSSASTAQIYLPVLVGIHLGGDELVLSPRAIGIVAGSSSSFAWMFAFGAGLDVPAGPIHLMPELDLACGQAGGSCVAYAAVSVRYPLFGPAPRR